MKKKSNNYLDYVPVRNSALSWDEDSNGQITIYIENKGCMNRLAQKLFHKPRISQVHLEQYGSFIWKQIDGVRTIGDIADLAQKRFGPEIYPLYERLSTYMTSLERSGFITTELDNRLKI